MKTMTTVEKIHNEIDTAQDRLLESALKVISETKINPETQVENKASRLTKLGFTSSLSVIKAKEITNKRDKKLQLVQVNKSQAEQIQYYKQKYPLHKFLTEEELERICDKYSLKFAPADRYIKDIPEKNIRDMEIMKEIEVADCLESMYKIKGTYSRFDNLLKDIGLKNGEITENEFEKTFKRFTDRSIPEDWRLGHVDGGWQTPLRLMDEVVGGGERWYCKSIEKISKGGLFIAAPPSHFNLKGLESKTKNGFFEIIKIEPKDPIVFKYVKGGVLVITKWGDEADDEMLTVDIQN